jgi:DNA sulfur modification protein DndB
MTNINLGHAMETNMTTTFEYVFPAIRGVQARREYYVSMCPLRLIPKIFLFDEEELVPELRAQRVLNKARIPEIATYIEENPDSYVFSAITASVDGDVQFRALGTDGEASRIGALHVDMRARFIINDGQHRRAAIEMAIRDEPTLGDETIAVVFFLDRGLERSQQMFADLNRYAIRPSRSLGLLYDHRNDLSKLAKLVALRSTAFKDVVEMEKSTLSERSRKLFTLSAIYTASAALLDGEELASLDAAVNRCIEFWDEVAKYLPEWGFVRTSKMTAGEVRRDFIHSHAIVLQALGIAGNQLTSSAKNEWRARLKALKNIDWARSNARLWEGRAMIGGRVSKASHNVTLTANVIKQRLSLELGPDEQRVENAMKRGQHADVH